MWGPKQHRQYFVQTHLFGALLTLGLSASTNCCDETIKRSIGRIVQNPSAFIILINLVDLGIEFGLALQSILLPKLAKLTEDLLSIRIPTCPLDRREESIHYGMNLEA